MGSVSVNSKRSFKQVRLSGRGALAFQMLTVGERSEQESAGGAIDEFDGRIVFERRICSNICLPSREASPHGSSTPALFRD